MDERTLKCLAYSPAEHAERAERILDITHGRSNGQQADLDPEGIGFLPPNAVPCPQCDRQAGFAGQTAGIVAYTCLNRHTHFADFSKELGLR